MIAYELLDEVMDFGYPQFTEAKILAEFIKTDAHRLAVQARPPMAVTNAVSWRQEGLFYKKNEVFLDVVESVNLLVNSNGTVVRSEVVGALKMRAYLSGMVSERASVGAGLGRLTVRHTHCTALHCTALHERAPRTIHCPPPLPLFSHRSPSASVG